MQGFHSSQLKTIYLVRHGAIETGTGHRFIGQTDLPLTREGVDQISKLAGHLKKSAIEKIFSSPLARCRQSGEILGAALQAPVQIIPALAEINLGSWDGLTKDEVKQHYPKAYEERGNNIDKFRPPEGESFLDLQKRVWSAFCRIALSDHANLLILAHAGVNRVILAKILGLNLAHIFTINQPYGCCILISYADGRFLVESKTLTF